MNAAYDPVEAAKIRAQFSHNGHHEPEEATSTPLFPVEILPEAMRAFVEQAADSLPVPVEMVAVPMLGMAGSVIGNRAHLALKASWREYPTLFFVVVAGPGRAKSPALKLARWPLNALQKDAKQRYDAERIRYEEEVADYKAIPAKERGTAPVPPRMRDYFSTDATMEALAGILERGPGVTISGDEITGWIDRMNQYRKGGDREQYMSIWASEPIKVDRKSAGCVYVDTPVICVVGGIQPDVVPRLHSEANVRDGFVERILPFIPDLRPKVWNTNTVSTTAYADVARLFRAIDGLPRATDSETGAMGIAVSLSVDAVAEWAAWSDRNNAIAANVGGILGGFYTKLEAHVARFALVLHVLANPVEPGEVEVSANTMQDAIELGEWFRAQMHLFVPMLGTGASIPAGGADLDAGLGARIMRIMRKCEHENPENEGWVSKSDIYRALRNIKTEQLTIQLDTFIDLGVLESRAKSGSTKTTTEYRIPGKRAFALSQIRIIRTIPQEDVPWA